MPDRDTTGADVADGGDLQRAKLAHELRTPLAAIVALAEVMRDERLGPIGHDGYKGYANDVYDTARHALEVISIALSGEAVPNERSAIPAMAERVAHLEIKNVEIDRLTADIVSAMRPLARKWGVNLILHDADRAMVVIADQRCLRQIVLNLLHNAMKFTPPGGVVEVRLKTPAGGGYMLEVADTGDGMGEDLVEAVRQVIGGHQGEKRARFSGNGIGLSVVSELVRGNGAHLTVESVPAVGTKVAVVFPPGRVMPL